MDRRNLDGRDGRGGSVDLGIHTASARMVQRCRRFKVYLASGSGSFVNWSVPPPLVLD